MTACLQKHLSYSEHPQHRACLTAGLQDPTIPQVPFEDKLHAIAYINSNCEAESGRSDLLRALMKLGDNAKVCVISRVTLTSSVLSGCCCGCWRAEAMVDCYAMLGCDVQVPVHSFGNCDRNMDWPDDNPTKFQVFSECVHVAVLVTRTCWCCTTSTASTA